MNRDDRLYTLDAMRGVAAILVVIYHIVDITGVVWLVSGGYLAVDFFFVLSGFVIARTYDGRLQAGLRPDRFMASRFIRFYPMFIIGLILSLIKALGNNFTGGENALTLMQIGTSLMMQLLILPSFTTPLLFPLNGPTWSLFLELFINFFYAIFFIRLRPSSLAVVAAIAGMALIGAVFFYRSLDIGWLWTNSWCGLVKVTYAFTVGVLIHRLGLIDSPRSGWLSLIPMGALVAFIVAPVSDDFRPFFDLGVALLGAPAIVILGASWQPPLRLRRACEALGDLSYPLYAVHSPFLVVAMLAAGSWGLPPLLWAPPLAFGLIVFAYGLGRWVDPPLRRKLDSILDAWPPRLRPSSADASSTGGDAYGPRLRAFLFLARSLRLGGRQ